jgi:hypothetical protein
MREAETAPLAAWKLPLIVAAIAIAIVGGFYLGGAGMGMAVGSLTAAAIVFMAVRKPPLGAIVPPPAHDLRRHLLVVLQAPLEQAAVVKVVVKRDPDRRGRRLRARGAAPRPLSQQLPRSLDLRRRPRPATGAAQPGPRRGGARCRWHSASARAGDEDMVQAVEDALRSFPATEVVLAGGAGGRDAALDRQVVDLRSRLTVPLYMVSPHSATAPATAARSALAGARA